MTVLDYLRKAANNSPDKIAFKDENKGITYLDLLNTAESICTSLSGYVREVNVPIAVMIDRNVESICSFFGIAMGRNFYVPIDSTQPLQRIQTIFEQMQPKAVIFACERKEEIVELYDADFLDYEDLINAKADRELIEKFENDALDTDPLYAMCTSGSTGVPKGVLVCNRSVMDFIPVFCKTFGFRNDEIFGNQAPFDFDVSIKDIYSTIYCEASMYIIPKVCFSMPKLLVEALDKNNVTTLIWAVSALCIAAGFNAFKHVVPGSLRNILFSGEVMPIKMLNVWRSYYPNAMFVNLYGPTEITCNCMYYIVDRDFENTEKLPLGIPFRNEGVLFLNEENKPISVGETGEICVKGTCLALGYYRNEEKTRQAFVQNPLNDSYPELMYRTGDLAELKEDGNYYFAARKDFQIKHMGHRIELEEIEMHINSVDGVSRACCLFDENKNKIVAFYVGEAQKTEVIETLKAKLPKYMIPNIYYQKEKFQLNKNGKIDRKVLREEYEKGIH